MGLLTRLSRRRLDRLPLFDMGREAERKPWCEIFTSAVQVEDYFRNTKLTWRRQGRALVSDDPKMKGSGFIIFKVGESKWVVHNNEERFLLEFDEERERRTMEENDSTVDALMERGGALPTGEEEIGLLERSRREVTEKIIADIKLRREELIRRKKTSHDD